MLQLVRYQICKNKYYYVVQTILMMTSVVLTGMTDSTHLDGLVWKVPQELPEAIQLIRDDHAAVRDFLQDSLQDSLLLT